ncbi:MAG TPA: acyl-CoA dehydrogenase family protein [Desulfatiglandales bacterium]|nr:acyl-CoA dehydrogenase family protein [Desulfatiglandales bacterium]
MDFELTKEQKDIVSAAKEFAEGEFPDRAEEFDRTETFDETLHKKAADLGFVGTFVEEEYGGPGMGLLEYCLIFEEFSAVDPGIAVAILISSYGAEIVQEFGSEEQKQRYLPPIVTGDAVMGSAFTEPDAGSDLAGATTSTALRNGDDFVINGSKMFITNGDRADYLICFLVTDPENADRHRRHSMIMVETDRQGFEANHLTGKLGIRASDTAEITFNNVKVPYSNLVGPLGNGFAEAMHLFNLDRVVVAAQAVGTARGALEESIRHVKKRVAFNAPLASFQAIQFKIADMFTWIQAGRHLVHEAAWRIDQGSMDHKLIAAAKSFCGQMAVKCTDMALQMHGGYGYLAEYKVQRLFRDAKITEIYEGTTEIEKVIMARNLLK